MSEFPTTAWTVVSRARGGADPEAREALAVLCAAYWLPLYSFARRLGHASDDALDLTQGYFALLIEKGYLADVRLREGRFRAFLLTSFRHCLSKERDRARAVKRGGGRLLISIDVQEAEERYAAEPLDVLDPEALFERQWAPARAEPTV
jgi:RNA polymerase sigma-70 factor (ECF subfamily)